MLHPILVFWKTNEKSHPWPEQAPNGINAAAIDGRVALALQNETWRSPLRRHRLRENTFAMHAFTYELIVS
jgi:hypothetical protein